MLFFIEFAKDFLDLLPVLQNYGQEDGFDRPGITHVGSGAGVQFGPAENTNQTPAGLQGGELLRYFR